jgi:hypothetical protein
VVELAGRPHGHCGSGTAVRKGRADSAKELGDEDGGVALRLGAIDPLQRRGVNLHGRGRAARAGARCAGRSERRLRSETRG